MATTFDIPRFLRRVAGHHLRLGIAYQAHGEDWAELTMPYHADLVGALDSGVIASGPVLTLMDMATSIAVWLKRGTFLPHATLDLRINYLRAAVPGRAIVGRGECYRLGQSIAFVRGQAHDGDRDDPIAHVTGTFMVTT